MSCSGSSERYKTDKKWLKCKAFGPFEDDFAPDWLLKGLSRVGLGGESFASALSDCGFMASRAGNGGVRVYFT